MRFTISFSLFLLPLFSFSQGVSLTDSLEKKLKGPLADTAKVDILYELSFEFAYSDFQKAFNYAQEALTLSNENNFEIGKRKAFLAMGVCYIERSYYDSAIYYFEQALTIAKRINDLNGIAATMNNMGNVYYYQGAYDKAISNYLSAVKMFEKQNKMSNVAMGYGNIGSIYDMLGDYKQALNYHEQNLKISTQLNDRAGMESAYNNIGLIYLKTEQLQLAEQQFLTALEICEKDNKQTHIPRIANNLGLVYKHQQQFDKALKSYEKANEIYKSIDDLDGMASTYNNIAGIYGEKSDFKKMLEYLEKALPLAIKMGSKPVVKDIYGNLTNAHSSMGNYKKAYEFQELYSAISDSIFNEEMSMQVAEMNTKYETEKKEQEIKLLNTNKELQESKLKRNRLITWSVAGILLLFVAFSFFIYNRFTVTSKQNKIIETQNSELEVKNHEIMDSINYAKKIQEALLISDSELAGFFIPQVKESPYFVFFKPKDIVSGDFYWATSLPGGEIVWAVADCTGHGVPGALMSMIGHSLLNEIVLEKKCNNPSLILNQLREGIVKALKQTGEEGRQKDGMDIAICVWSPVSYSLTFSGANNPLWIIREKEHLQDFAIYGPLIKDRAALVELKPDRQPVGFLSLEMKSFTETTVQLRKGDRLYLFSDGFGDQFGGPKGKKFMAKNLKELLLDLCHLPMPQQKEKLIVALSDWMDNRYEQVDDICVFGVKV